MFDVHFSVAYPNSDLSFQMWQKGKTHIRECGLVSESRANREVQGLMTCSGGSWCTEILASGLKSRAFFFFSKQGCGGTFWWLAFPNKSLT